MDAGVGHSYHLSFTVASALLRELGERLVGQPHIALAELVKNAYDADAERVEIRIERDRIEVRDNGHGMDPAEFEHFWMRIGSAHKLEQPFSRRLRRPMTGSKGVGRLAVQFLARHLSIHTVSERAPDTALSARVDWDRAVQAGDLTRAEARVRRTRPLTRFPADKPHGTVIRLHRLNHVWDTGEIKDLARQVWWMQPPFRASGDRADFFIDLTSSDRELRRAFDDQVVAVLKLWHARLKGRLAVQEGKNQVALALEFVDGSAHTIHYSVEGPLPQHLTFEIRVFHLQHRQKEGVKVNEARRYLNTFGGVGVYDAGFRLPYYGPDQDWLEIEFDHSHRLHRSRLLPDKLHVSRGLNFLPTNSRLFGAVHVNTALEQDSERSPAERLMIQITRDRLVNNVAYQGLKEAVRWALDFYAMQEAKRQFAEKASKPTRQPSERLAGIAYILAEYREQVPGTVLDEIQQRVREAAAVTEEVERATAARTGLLGALATAGITALAYQHEIGQQFQLLNDVVSRLRAGAARLADTTLAGLADDLATWLDRGRATRELFAPLMEEGNREERRRFRATVLIGDVRRRLGVLLRGVEVDLSRLDPELRLPAGSYVEWAAIFQNVFLNAVNAALDSDEKRIAVVAGPERGRQALRVLDTGVGIDLAEADRLFQPFERRLVLSAERRALALGGTGLGLTIVRMVAEALECRVRFVEPDPGYATAFEINWRE